MFSKLICRFNAISIKIPMILFLFVCLGTSHAASKICKKEQGPQNRILKKKVLLEWCERVLLPVAGLIIKL